MLDTNAIWISSEALKCLQLFKPPSEKLRRMYTDNSFEFTKYCVELAWTHGTSTPRRPQTYGIVVSGVRRVKEGTAAALVQSGSWEEWWNEAMACCCRLRNICDTMADGETAEELWNESVECYCHLRHV